MLPYWPTIDASLQRHAHLGTRSFGDGTALIGHLPRLAPHAFLHRIFGPLSDTEIRQIEERLQMQVPPSLAEFYRHFNGVMLFDTAICVYGLRRSWDRADVDAMQCNPFDVYVPTLTYRSCSPSGHGIAISQYDDLSQVLVEPDGTVVRVRESPLHPGEVLNRWGSLGDWLLSECRRVEDCIDRDGTFAYNPKETMPPARPSWLN